MSKDTKTIQSKICTKCKECKPLPMFSKHKGGKYGVQSICKLCRSMESKERYVKNKDAHRNAALKSLYGITLKEYNKMFDDQGGRCAICESPETGTNQYGTKRLAVDHNHNDGKVRQLLCEKCNRALGLLNDDLEVILKAYEYLKKHED